MAGTHEVFNQVPPLEDYAVNRTDAALTEAEHILVDYVTLAKPKAAAPVAKQP